MSVRANHKTHNQAKTDVIASYLFRDQLIRAFTKTAGPRAGRRGQCEGMSPVPCLAAPLMLLFINILRLPAEAAPFKTAGLLTSEVVRSSCHAFWLLLNVPVIIKYRIGDNSSVNNASNTQSDERVL